MPNKALYLPMIPFPQQSTRTETIFFASRKEDSLRSRTLSSTVFSSANKKPSREIHGTAVKIISYTYTSSTSFVNTSV